MAISITCPACNKTNPGTSTAVCSRCGADLSLLFLIRTAADWHLAEGAAALRACQWTLALGHAEQAWELRHSDQCARLGFLAAAASHDLDATLRWRARTEPTIQD